MGEDERHAIDLYLVEAKQPTPLVIYIHGGGFARGGKLPVPFLALLSQSAPADHRESGEGYHCN